MRETGIIPPQSAAHFTCTDCDGGYLVFELHTIKTAKRPQMNQTLSRQGASIIDVTSQNHVYYTRDNGKPNSKAYHSTLPEFIVHDLREIEATGTEIVDNKTNTSVVGDTFEPLSLDLVVGWKYNGTSKRCELFAKFHECVTSAQYRKEINQWKVYIHVHICMYIYIYLYLCNVLPIFLSIFHFNKSIIYFFIFCLSRKTLPKILGSNESVNIGGGRNTKYVVKAQNSPSLGKDGTIQHFDFSISSCCESLSQQVEQHVSASLSPYSTTIKVDGAI
ncbi:hypothetical protein RFI_06179 [Reticulomyxa filosa]|uniref:Uncharacterized protein n=1 Tax=Reticulomyxa filosa TaxID=46433 RepID=X6NYM9_RETFI|nr:hypothetical protein RFI_06179 [Reticulomyxa filosa]|eukprot:ETO30944.1 hypothetical protein RFI_06179 [Reticulomyxa filosa]